MPRLPRERSAPHLRGWSGEAARAQVLPIVGPALVGMVRASMEGSHHVSGRPRTCGGWSLQPGQRRTGERVGPALAGMVRLMSTVRDLRAGRPRTWGWSLIAKVGPALVRMVRLGARHRPVRSSQPVPAGLSCVRLRTGFVGLAPRRDGPCLFCDVRASWSSVPEDAGRTADYRSKGYCVMSSKSCSSVAACRSRLGGSSVSKRRCA